MCAARTGLFGTLTRRPLVGHSLNSRMLGMLSGGHLRAGLGAVPRTRSLFYWTPSSSMDVLTSRTKSSLSAYILSQKLHDTRPFQRLLSSDSNSSPNEDLDTARRRFQQQREQQREQQQQKKKEGIQSTLLYAGSVIIGFIGLSYLAVPLYQLICTQTGLDGTPLTAPGHKFEPESMVPVKGGRKIKVTFDASLSESMGWSFIPEVPSVTVVPGETALTFFKASNPTEEDIVGISTYSVVPAKAAQYFNKIQCFCFEEQKLAAKEEVDMPVFFYIDPEFTTDPWMKDVGEVTLHYTFFRSKNQS